MTAKSIDEAKQALLNNLNLDQFEVYDFEVIQEPTKGFLGIGSKDAEVRLLIKTDKLQKGKFLVTEMCKHMGYSVDFQVNLDEEKQELRFEFSGDDATKMFKRLGRGAHKMEFLINCILNRKDRESYLRTVFVHENLSKVSEGSSRNGRRDKRDFKNSQQSGEGRKRVGKQTRRDRSNDTGNVSGENNDADLSTSSRERNRNNRGNHRRRDKNFDNERGQRRNRSDSKTSSAREAYLKNTAERMAKQVIESQKSVAMNPMNSYDRRIVHSALTDTKNISTRSEGENDKRYVVIEFSAE